MFNYLEDIIVECPDDLKKATSIFPANNNLFKLNKDYVKNMFNIVQKQTNYNACHTSIRISHGN